MTAIDALLRTEGLPLAYLETVERFIEPLAKRIASTVSGPGYLVAICGSQASGKTTASKMLERMLAEQGLTSAILSLDDLYLPLAERRRLAAEVHPLFITRGVPGTHDVALGVRLAESLRRRGPTLMPRFDKASDERTPEAEWPIVQGPVDVILFEGWCVGAIPQPPEALAQPVNALERDEDPAGVWRRYANENLAGPYQTLYGLIDLLVLMAAPSFEVVLGWRIEQEAKLRAARGASAGMSDVELARFVRHYERLTGHILAEMPARADIVARLGPQREVLEVTFRRPQSIKRSEK